MGFFSDLSARHEALKKRIHSFRIPLGPTGQKVMGFVYFCIPIIGGYYLMEYVTAPVKKLEEERLKDPSLRVRKEVQDQNAALQSVLSNAQIQKQLEDARQKARAER